MDSTIFINHNMPKRKRISNIFETGIKRVKIEMLAKKRTISKFRKRKSKKSLSAKINRILDKRIESKKIGFDYSQADILGTPFFSEVTAMSQGVTEASRVGNQINPTYLEYKIAFTAPTTTLTPNFIRLMIVQSRTGPLLVGDLPAAYGSLPDIDRFNVLEDSIISCNTSGGEVQVGNPGVAVWQGSHVLKRMPGVKQTVQYDSTTAASDEGGIYLFAIAGDADIDIDDGYAYMRYKDA